MKKQVVFLYQQMIKRIRKHGLFVLCLGVFCCLGACTPTDVTGEDASVDNVPTTLDLRGKGLTDVTDLLQKTQLTEIDLRDNEITTADFVALSAALPDCEILWSVPLGETRFDSDSTALLLDVATDNLVDMLAYFPQLQSVQLAAAPDAATAKDLAERYPEVHFLWDVTIDGVTYAPDTETLDFSGKTVDLSALLGELAGLSNLKSIVFGEETFALADQIALAKAYPQISFVWNVQLLEDLSVRSDVTELDLRKYQVPDAAAFSDALVLFPKLTLLDMCGSGPSDEEMAAMRARYPSTKFVWYTHVYNWVIRTDIKGFSTGQRRKFPNGAGWYDSDTFTYRKIRSKDFENLKYCTDLIALDVGHCTKIGDIDFIATLPKLKILDISLCDLTDISVLADQTKLEFLEMNYNYLTDISPLASCKKLKYVNLNNNNLTSYDALLELPDLERLWISCSGLSDDQLAEMIEKLTALRPNLTIKASQSNREYAMSYWRKDNPGYLEMQALFGLRAQNQGSKED